MGEYNISLESNAVETLKDFLRFVTSLYLLSLLVFSAMFFFLFLQLLETLKPKRPLVIPGEKKEKELDRLTPTLLPSLG